MLAEPASCNTYKICVADQSLFQRVQEIIAVHFQDSFIVQMVEILGQLGSLVQLMVSEIGGKLTRDVVFEINLDNLEFPKIGL